jgi:hypothetical protein
MDTTRPTGKMLCDLLPKFLEKITKAHEERGDLIMAAWPEIIGAKLAPMTQALSFDKGVLTVKVKNSTLHSLLSQHEKNRLLQNLKQRFPKAEIRSIIFRIG